MSLAVENGLEICDETQQACKTWLQEHRHELPEAVACAFTVALDLATQIGELKTKQRALFKQLLRALGITPSSERCTKPADSGEPRGDTRRQPNPAERLRTVIEHSKTLMSWHRLHARRHDKKRQVAEKKLMNVKVEDIVLSQEEEAALEREHEEYVQRLELGDGADARLAPQSEALMHGVAAIVQHEDVKCEVDRLSLPNDAKIRQEFADNRTRIDFSFSVTALNIEVEQLAVATSEGTTVISASLEEIGPSKMAVTWNFLASMAILVSQFAMPMNRFARLASSTLKRFTGGEIGRYYAFVAGRFAPIYECLGKAVANAPVLVGDDTTSLVLEVSKALAEEGGHPPDPLPWKSYATIELAHKARLTEIAAIQAAKVKAKAKNKPIKSVKPSLAVRLAATFGFAFERKDETGEKIGFNTSFLSGRADPDDPKSTIVFYRSHLGGLGNLLNTILCHRRPENHKLVVQSDLSTVNLISDETLRRRLDITLAGCTSHARRPFSLHENDDPDTCAELLHAFKGIGLLENCLNAVGRNEENTLAVRRVDHRALWKTIQAGCERLLLRWSRRTPLGVAARYVLRHFAKLTYYLDDARIAPWNNFSERMLRLEKLIANNSMFRQTIEGRCALDIMRTVLQTAIAAEVNPAAYLIWVMRMPSEVVESSPAEFTPMAFASWWSEQEKQCRHDEVLANTAAA